MNLFVGRTAREGVTSTVAVKGTRKLTMNELDGTRYMILAEEKIYDLDVEKSITGHELCGPPPSDG